MTHQTHTTMAFHTNLKSWDDATITKLIKEARQELAADYKLAEECAAAGQRHAVAEAIEADCFKTITLCIAEQRRRNLFGIEIPESSASNFKRACRAAMRHKIVAG